MRTEGVGEFATPLVVTFAEAATLDHSELGAKAANLGASPLSVSRCRPVSR